MRGYILSKQIGTALIRDFQITGIMPRKDRSHKIQATSICIVFFQLVYLNGLRSELYKVDQRL